MPGDLVKTIANMKEKESIDLAKEMLEKGEDLLKIFEFCREAVEMVGKRFEAGEYFLPELILAGEILKKISKMAKPFFEQKVESKTQCLGKVVIGTVEGDIHNIGKDIVTFILDVNGFEVHDLGVDVAPARFIEAIKKVQPEIVGMSALLTLAFESLKNTVEAIKESGLRDQVKIMIGGGAVDDKIRIYADADAYGPDAVAAVNLAKDWIGAQ